MKISVAALLFSSTQRVSKLVIRILVHLTTWFFWILACFLWNIYMSYLGEQHLSQNLEHGRLFSLQEQMKETYGYCNKQGVLFAIQQNISGQVIDPTVFYFYYKS